MKTRRNQKKRGKKGKQIRHRGVQMKMKQTEKKNTFFPKSEPKQENQIRTTNHHAYTQVIRISNGNYEY